MRWRDIREPADAERVVDHVLERHGRLDMLVNNAGGQYFVPAEAIASKGWQAVWRLNVRGTPEHGRGGRGAGDAPGRLGHDRQRHLLPAPRDAGMAHRQRRAPPSSRSRAGWRGAGRGSVSRWWPSRPGTTAPRRRPSTQVVRAGAARTVPLGRLGEPIEHAWLIALLASPLGRSLNGSVVTLDGARDNWFGPWPPQGLTDDGGEVPTEARRTQAAGG